MKPLPDNIGSIDGYLIQRDDESIPEMLGQWFARMDSNQQVRFLKAVRMESEAWPTPAEFQWRYWEEDIDEKTREMIQAWLDHTS